MLAVQPRVLECEADWAPVPESETAIGELVASLVNVTVPVAAAADAGAKVTFRVAVCPGATTCPVETPLAMKPAPEMLTFETVTFEFPALVKVTPKIFVLPTPTLEKLRLVVLALSMSVVTLTVRVAGLLVVLPTLFVTVTVNCAPESDADVAGVV